MANGSDTSLLGITADAFLLSALTGLQDSRAATGEAEVDQQSVAVLPFTNISGDAGQQYLCDGITEDIMIRLARFRELKVAARSAAFRFQGDADSGDAGRSLGVRYIVRGTAIKSGARLVVSCQLIEAASGNLIWGEKYNRESSDIFQVQDEVTGRIVTALGSRVITAGASSARRKATTSWSAYDYFLKGRELCNAARESESEPFFAKALQLDPDFALAMAWQAIGLLGQFWTTAERQFLDRANECALEALELDPDEACAHHAAGMTHNYLKRYDRSAGHFKRAVELNPLDVHIGGDYASLLLHIGRTDDALRLLREVLERDPYPPAWLHYAEGKCLFFAGRHADAVAALERAGPGHFRVHSFLAANYAVLGRLEDARREVGIMLAARPGLNLDHLKAFLPFADSKALDPFFAAMRKAGFEGGE